MFAEERQLGLTIYWIPKVDVMYRKLVICTHMFSSIFLSDIDKKELNMILTQTTFQVLLKGK